jgi:PAS domain S-box-containing protein
MADSATRLSEIIGGKSFHDPRRSTVSPDKTRAALSLVALEESRFGTLFENVPLGIFICDATSEELPVVYCNPALEQITGYSRGELIGRSCLSWHGGHADIPSPRELRDAVGDVRDSRFTLKLTNRRGETTWHELSVSPVRDATGYLTHLLGIKTDITKRREAEIKIAEQTRSLKASQQALEDQSRALRKSNEMLRENQTQLVHSEKMASLGQLAAGIAHEINNPIGFIRSNLATLNEYVETFKVLFRAYDRLAAAIRIGDPDQAQEAFQEVEVLLQKEDLGFVLDDIDLLLAESINGAERVKEIVQNLKSFARIDEAEIKEADVNEGLRATVRMLWNELKYKCTVTEKLHPLPPIRCFPSQLNQVFMNLLVNGAQAIADKGEIILETEATDTEIVIRVTDTGCGIPAENIPRLFNPFFTTKPVGKGTGLGLAISYGIIKKHQGTIGVESEVGKGTTFTIRLPLAAEPDRTPSPATLPA